MIPPTDEENKYHKKQKVYHVCKKRLSTNDNYEKYHKSYKKQKVCYVFKKGFSGDYDNKRYHKVRVHCHYIGK